MGGPEDGMPCEIFAPNRTPAALAGWTDGEIYLAIVSGVDKDGHALFAMMPYPYYRGMDPEDVNALVAYIRALPSRPVTLPEMKLPMPLPVIMRFVARDAAPEKRPSTTDAVALGKYLAVTGRSEEHTY